MSTWVAILIVIAVGGLLIYWHFSGTQIMSNDRSGSGSFFDGVSGVGHQADGHGVDSGHGGDGGVGGGDGGAGGGDG